MNDGQSTYGTDKWDDCFNSYFPKESKADQPWLGDREGMNSEGMNSEGMNKLKFISYDYKKILSLARHHRGDEIHRS